MKQKKNIKKPVDVDNFDIEKTPFSSNMNVNVCAVKNLFGDSFDLITKETEVAGVEVTFFLLDGMCSELKITEAVLKPLTDAKIKKDTPDKLYDKIEKELFKGTDLKKIETAEDAAISIIAGNLILIADENNSALSFSMQGYPKKSITEPNTEQNEKGSHEGFADSYKDNATLIRRRLATPFLRLEKSTVGSTSNTPVLLCYLSDRVNDKLLEKVKKRLSDVKLDVLLGTGFLKHFFDEKKPSFFSDTGLTERPDVLASKLAEGRIGIIVEGTPYALVIPYMMIDYFHTLDDYLGASYYALFMRCIRIACFIIAAVLPGLFVATCIFHPELMPSDMMYDIAKAESATPFPLMLEALIIHFIYEIVREAGLRMPESIGHAVSIVGALVIGDAAVTAKLIAAPMLIVVALTAVTSAVIARLHEPIAVMRFGFIIIGGITGFFGIMLGIGLLLTDICSVNPYGIPFSAPFSPFVLSAQRDNVFRRGWRKLGRKQMLIQEMKY